MRLSVTCMLIAGSLLFVAGSASAAADLGPWFYRATAMTTSSNNGRTTRPDFLPGNSMHAMRCTSRGAAIGNGIWRLLKYDRVHNIGLAAATTDQCSVAVFKASPPGANVPTEDLSKLSSGRGIRIGSTYDQVLAAYGGTATKSGSHFVVAYGASIPDKSLATGKTVNDDETMTFVFDGNRVSAMTFTIDLSIF